MRFAVGAVIALYAASCLNSMFPSVLSLLGQLGAALAVVLACLAALGGAGFAALRKQWARCGWRIGIVAVSLPIALAGFVRRDLLHLLVMYPYYRSVIAGTPQRPVRFVWGDTALFVMDGLDMRTLVFDDTGTTRRLAGADRDGPDGLYVTDDRLLGNFYLEHLHN